MVWLEDMIEEMIVPREKNIPMSKDLESKLVESIIKVVNATSCIFRLLMCHSCFKVAKEVWTLLHLERLYEMRNIAGIAY